MARAITSNVKLPNLLDKLPNLCNMLLNKLPNKLPNLPNKLADNLPNMLNKIHLTTCFGDVQYVASLVFKNAAQVALNHSSKREQG